VRPDQGTPALEIWLFLDQDPALSGLKARGHRNRTKTLWFPAQRRGGTKRVDNLHA